MTGTRIIVMGVSGSGKSTVGEMLAQQLDAIFIDGDALHPQANIDKMAAGHPLNDGDRLPWLNQINQQLKVLETSNQSGVIVCSALKRQYRQILRQGLSNLLFLFLDGDEDTIAQRMKARQGHFMKAGMLASQFSILERPSAEEYDVITVKIDHKPEEIVATMLTQLSRGNVR